MRKLILKNGFSPGDIVMLTAAVRDLHACYPGQFVTDVRTACGELWENNPFITPLREADPDVEVIDCHYPLIDRCNELPYHCLHGFVAFLNERLGLSIQPTRFKGDIWLSDLEKSWFSQVRELTGEDIPFWIVAAGGKYDVTVKWWERSRYQQVVDHFRGRVQFVQVGEWGHHHPKLNGVIDLRGQTTLRELVRLVHHAQGVLCPVTALMHLAAAVEAKERGPNLRPCVVVAGGREPAHWEAYPGHQFIHTNGALPCCAEGGCWKDRTVRLGDGDPRDSTERLCVDVVAGLPRCLDLITAAEVIGRIETYLQGRAVRYLTSRQAKAAQRGVTASASNRYDEQPLTLSSARMACERFLQSLPAYPQTHQGRGIVICGGGVKYFTCAWVCVNMLRRLGCALPIQLWHLGPEEINAEMESIIGALQVECVDATARAEISRPRILRGWELKPYAILHCPFQEVLLLDADNVPVMNPEFLFESPPFRETGAIFWPDYGRSEKADVIWRSCGLARPAGPEFETGQIVIDKKRCWDALSLCLWFNENSDFYYQYLHGDKETFHLAFRKLQKSFSLVPTPIHSLAGTMCQHDFAGRRLFQHRNMDKWNLFLRNKVVEDFWFEKACREDLARLREIWDGRAREYRGRRSSVSPRGKKRKEPLRLRAWLISSPAREHFRRQTLRNLAATDWGEEPELVLASAELSWAEGKAQAVPLALREGLEGEADYILILEDALDFVRHLRHNLLHWGPVRNRQVTLAGLFNPDLRVAACDVPQNAYLVAPQCAFGGQAFLLARPTVKRLLCHWSRLEAPLDLKMATLAGRQQQPLFYHAPSLVQSFESGVPDNPLRAVDFDPFWKADRWPAAVELR